ncbi:alpha/beta fold hydrolase [Saccharothrix violaceirubra]|uniref:Pimeloyl-ACP methyl ester carboxylesterase n=1 Tax=Saccharothrix violaceirubra TaxID=413306 RepID=A0A7W7WVP0_9PSEU|nr:alpha/beta hydrolase [Saccharothrix violaceirubra]MBB4965102.1 pimeloyl-ACP methyl ester carboxylesterase [Saccharothrix violaceirubra]
MTADVLVELPDADVHVEVLGVDGPPVVLVHGFLTSSYTWRHVAPLLASGFRVYLVDLPACGRSPVPRSREWDARRCVALLGGVLDHLGVERPVLAGSQMGGSLVAWFTALHPERVGRLVVMAAGALGEARSNLLLYRLLANPLVGPVLARAFPRTAFGDKWRDAHGPGFTPEVDAVDRYHRQLRERGSAIAAFGLGFRRDYGAEFDRLAPLLAGCAVPTLLLFGQDDPLVPPSTGRRFRELLADAELVLLPGCGDFPQEERAEEVAVAVVRFLTR